MNKGQSIVWIATRARIKTHLGTRNANIAPLGGIRIRSDKSNANDANQANMVKKTSPRCVLIVFRANTPRPTVQRNAQSVAVVSINPHRVKPIAFDLKVIKLLEKVVPLSSKLQKVGLQRATQTILPYRVKQDVTAQIHLQKHVLPAQPVTLRSKETSTVFNVKRGNFPIKSILPNVQNATHDCVNTPTKLLPPVANVVQRTNVRRAPSVNL